MTSYADSLPLEVADRPHPIGPEQLNTADMETRQPKDGLSGLHVQEERRGEVQADVNGARGQGLRHFTEVPAEVSHLREPLARQELCDHILRSPTDAGGLPQPNSCRLRRRLRGH